MKKVKLLHWIIVASMIFSVAGVAATPAGADPQRERFTGTLINVVRGARTSQPFVLTIDRFASGAEMERLTGILSHQGAYSLRDAMWRLRAGTLSVGGGLGYPVSVALSRDTSSGQNLRVLINRPLHGFEVAHSTRSAHYLFDYLELNLDKDGRGQGVFIAAASLRLNGTSVEVKSLGVQPLRMLDVRAD